MPDDKPGADGVITILSQHSVDETVSRLERLLQAKAAKVFAIVNHSSEAEQVGLRMPNTKLIIFGSPKAGTPLMLAAPSIAIDLPLKILIWQDVNGRVWVSYNSPEFLRQRHNLPPDLMQTLAVTGVLAENIAS